MTLEEQVVETISKAIVQTVKQMFNEQNIALERKLANIKISGDNILPGSIDGTKITNGTLTGSKMKNGSITGMKITDGSIGQAQIGELIAGTIDADELNAAVINAVEGYFDTLEIDTAKIRDLDVFVANITNASIQKAKIDLAQIDELTANWADIVSANINTATIDWAQIRTIINDTTINARFVGEQMFIDGLAVNDANIVNLTANKLVIKGTDEHGEDVYYQLFVDGSSGTVMSKLVQVDGDALLDGTVDGGEKIVEGSITASRLNVQDIFANNATIANLIASHIDVNALLAREIWAGKITTSMLSSDVGQSLDLTGNEGIQLMVSRTKTEILDEVDEQIGYRVEIVSTSDVLSDEVNSTTLTARVWHGNKNVTDDMAASCFNWKRRTTDSAADSVWNETHKGMKSITVTVRDVYYSATYDCEFSPPQETAST